MTTPLAAPSSAPAPSPRTTADPQAGSFTLPRLADLTGAGSATDALQNVATAGSGLAGRRMAWWYGGAILALLFAGAWRWRTISSGPRIVIDPVRRR